MIDYSETMPVQYKKGYTTFMGMEVSVDPRVLIPRPETELLVNTVANILTESGRNNPLILDLGTGSGIIPLGLTKLVDGCKCIAADISEDALEVARKNICSMGCEDAIELVASDMFSAFYGNHENIFDCIVSNPPYVSKKDYADLDAWVLAEPKIALYAGSEGMDYLDIISGESMKFLSLGGFVAVEVGYDQAETVKSRFKANGLSDITSFTDFNGYERVIAGWKHG